MKSKYLPEITAAELKTARESDDKEVYFDLLAQPLHQELYNREDFNFLDDLSDGQQLLLSYDYVREQVMQGGFIQLIQNGYIHLLPQMPGWLNEIGDVEMSLLLDDVLKVYVLNHELLDKKTTVEEFALLYQELKEFEILDERFYNLNDNTRDLILNYATKHIEDFVKVV
jgi:hypothetical protein